MPKSVQAIDTGTFKNVIVVPLPGEGRKASDIEGPVRELLNNMLYLANKQTALLNALNTHIHTNATDVFAGFMSPGDKQKLDGLSASLAAHAHTVATITAPGFMSAPDKVKLNGIEIGAEKMSRAKILSLLGIKFGERDVGAVAIGAGQTRIYTVNMAGVKYADSVMGSEYMSGDGNFAIAYHCIDGAVEIRIRNQTSTSREFSAAINFAVLPS